MFAKYCDEIGRGTPHGVIGDPKVHGGTELSTFGRLSGSGGELRTSYWTDPPHLKLMLALNRQFLAALQLMLVLGRRWRSNPSGKCSRQRLTRGTVSSTMRRAAHPWQHILLDVQGAVLALVNWQ